MVDCLSKIIATYTGELSKTEIAETTDFVQGMYEDMVGMQGKSYAEFQTAYMEKLHRIREFAIADRVRRLQDIVRHEESMGQAARMLAAKDYIGAIHSIFSRTGRWTRTNIESAVQTSIVNLSNHFTAFMNEQYPNQSRVWGAILKSGEKDAEIVKAIANFDEKLKVKYVVTDVDALKIGAAINKFNKYSYMELKKAGFTLNERGDYIVGMKWSAVKIRKAFPSAMEFIDRMRSELDIDQYKEKMNLRYDPETIRSIKKLVKSGIDQKEAIDMAIDSSVDVKLAELYNTLIEKDIHTDIAQEGTPRAASSFNSLNNRVSRGRTLPYKNAEAFHRLYQEFGQGSLFAGLHGAIKQNGRIIGRTQIFGTSPSVGFQKFLQAIKSKAIADGDEAMVKKLNDRQHEFEARFKYAAGFTEHSADNLVGKAITGFATVTNLAMLGSAGVMAAVSDPAFGFSLSKGITDDSMFTRFFAQAHNIALMFKTEQRADIAHHLDILVNDEIFDLFAEHMAMNPPAEANAKLGKAMLLMNKTNDTYSKLTLLKGGAYAARTNNARIFAGAVAESQPKVLKQLANYGIKPEDMAVLLAGVDDSTGFKIVSSEKVSALSIDELKKVYGERTKKASEVRLDGAEVKVVTKDIPWEDIDYLKERDMTLSRYRQAVNDFAYTGSPTPTKNMMYTLFGDGNLHTVQGAAGRLLGVYKSFMFAVYTNVQRSMYEGSNGAKRSFLDGSLGGLLVSTTVAGMAASMLKDIIQGKTPRDPTRSEFILEAMDRGGATGIFGSILLASYSKGKQDPVSDLAGPIVGRMYPDMLELLNEAKGRKLTGKDVAAKALRWTPLQNAWFGEALLKRYLLDRIKTTINPRFKSGQKSQLKQMSGGLTKQEMYLGTAPKF